MLPYFEVILSGFPPTICKMTNENFVPLWGFAASPISTPRTLFL
jgi:hypothetical protein